MLNKTSKSRCSKLQTSIKYQVADELIKVLPVAIAGG